MNKYKKEKLLNNLLEKAYYTTNKHRRNLSLKNYNTIKETIFDTNKLFELKNYKIDYKIEQDLKYFDPNSYIN
jgi:hypothetical protein